MIKTSTHKMLKINLVTSDKESAKIFGEWGKILHADAKHEDDVNMWGFAKIGDLKQITIYNVKNKKELIDRCRNLGLKGRITYIYSEETVEFVK